MRLLGDQSKLTSFKMTQILLLLFCVILAMEQLVMATTEFHHWHKYKISSARLDAGRSVVYTGLTRISCSVLAHQKGWVYVFTFNDGVCTLSDVPVEAYTDESSLGAATDVMTEKYQCYAGK